jgi:hypothetical protein
MFGSTWSFTRPTTTKKGEQQPLPLPSLRRESFPDESFDVGNDSTIYLSKKELGEFGKLVTTGGGGGAGKLAGRRVEIYDKEEEDSDQRSLTSLTVSPPSTTTSSSGATNNNNTESHRFWINCLKENGVLDLSTMSLGGHYHHNHAAAAAAAVSSPAHLRYLAAIRSPRCNGGSSALTPSAYNNSSKHTRGTIFASSRDDSEMLTMNETEETTSILSSQLSYSPSSIGVTAAVEYTLGEETLLDEKISASRPTGGCFLTECLRVPSYGEYDDDDDDDDGRLDICHPPSDDSLAIIHLLPSDMTLKTKITAVTEESSGDDYTDDAPDDDDKKIASSGTMSTNTTRGSDYYCTAGDKKIYSSGSMTTNTTRFSLLSSKEDTMEYAPFAPPPPQLASPVKKKSFAEEHVPLTEEHIARDSKHDQYSNNRKESLPLEEVDHPSDKVRDEFLVSKASTEEVAVDQQHDKIGVMSVASTAPAAAEFEARKREFDAGKEEPIPALKAEKVESLVVVEPEAGGKFEWAHKIGDMSLASVAPAAEVEARKSEFNALQEEHIVPAFEAKNVESLVVVEPEAGGGEFEWAYNVWKSKGLMKTSSPRFEYVKDRRKSSGGKSKRTSTGSYNSSAHKSVDLYKLESPGEELIDPECLVTPTDSPSTFGFQDLHDNHTPEPAPVKSANDRRSFPLSRPSVKKLQEGKSFANVMQMWKKKSDDKPNSHFLSPEQNIPASDYKVLSAEQKRAAATAKGQFDRNDVVKMKYHNRATPHAPLVSVTSMVSTVSSQLTGATSYEADHPLKLNESDSQSVFSMSDNRSFMTSDGSRDGTESGSVTLRYLRPKKDVGEQHAQRRSPPVRGTSIDEQLMMPLPRRMSSGGRSKSRRAASQRRRRLSDTMIPPHLGQSGDSSDFSKATSPRDHFRRNKSPPKSRGDYKSVVQTFLGQVNEHSRDDTSHTSHTPPREPRTNFNHMPPLPEAGGIQEEVRLESIIPVAATASMNSYRLHQQPYSYDLSQNQSCESSSSFGGGSFSWRFDSLSQNQSSESVLEINKFPFTLAAVDETIPSSGPMIKSRGVACDSTTQQKQRFGVKIGGRCFGRVHGQVSAEESGEDSGFVGADTSRSREANAAGNTSPTAPIPRNRVTPRDVQHLTKSAPVASPIPEDYPWTKHILQNLDDSQEDQRQISPREDSKERPWRSDLVFERVCHIGDHHSTMSENNTTGQCNCASSVFSGNDELIEFFLPQMGMACTCGRRPSGLVNAAEPTALENILRPWQVVFLAGFGIHRGDQLVKAHHRSANALASALRQYRRKQDMTPFRTKSCGMALQIWAKTCKAYVRSIRKQLTLGTTELKVPNTLYILSSFLERMHEDQTQQSPAPPTPLSDDGGGEPIQAEI